MVRTIAGYTYDTQAAELVRKTTQGEFGDPAGYEETLYRMPDGRFFLYFNGGAESIHAKEDIRRISKDRAQKWLEEA